MTDVLNVSSFDFEGTVLKSDKPVLVDFWASWCGPCKMIAPILKEVAEEHGEALQVVKINVDTDPDIAKSYGIRGIPTLLLFKDGKIIDNKIGAMNKSQLNEFLAQHLKR